MKVNVQKSVNSEILDRAKSTEKFQSNLQMKNK